MVWIVCFLQFAFAQTLLTTDPVLALKARTAGLKVSGEAVFQVTWESEKPSANSLSELVEQGWVQDFPLLIYDQQFKTQEKSEISYVAGPELGLDQFRQRFPLADGRGVRVGVVDDGISPILPGFQKTTEGLRKILDRNWSSRALDVAVKEQDQSARFAGEVLKRFPSANLLIGELDEERLAQGFRKKKEADLNEDGVFQRLSLAVIDQKTICLDSNANERVEESECFGFFAETGEYGFWTTDKLISVEAQFESGESLVRLSWGERKGSHGEGVASVAAAFQGEGSFSGVAPGAQLLDYDLKDPSLEPVYFSMSRFLTAIEWMAQKRVDIVNISYGFFFENLQSQQFMRTALQKLVDKYNVLIVFSAGNNGPGLGSFNRSLIYPRGSLTVGAFVSKSLDERVWGTGGLPEEGRLAYYSNRGPGPDHSLGISVIAPMSATTQSLPRMGSRAFSGTSSASPAIAGMAAVLLSHLKRLKVPFHAETLSDAIRLSASPIAGESAVDQGYGLPNINRALTIYRELLKADRWADATIQVEGVPTEEGVSAQGLFLLMSELAPAMEFRVSVEGIKSGTAVSPAEKMQIEYSSPLIRGPEHLWVGTGKSAFSVSLDSAGFFSEEGKTEFLGSVKLKDSRGRLIKIIPVVVVKDRELKTLTRWQGELPSYGARRWHFRLSEEVVAIRVKLTSDHTNQKVFPYVFDTARNRISPKATGFLRNHFVVPVEKGGHYQAGLVRSKGSDSQFGFDLSVEPISVKVSDLAVVEKKLQLLNSGNATEWKVVLRQAPVTVIDELLLANGNYYQSAFKARTKGRYRVNFQPTRSARFSKGRISCFAFWRDKKVSVVKKVFKLPEEAEGEDVIVRCLPYSFTGNDHFKEPYWMQVDQLSDNERSVLTHLEKGSNTVLFPELESGEHEVCLQPILGSGEACLGRVHVIEHP